MKDEKLDAVGHQTLKMFRTVGEGNVICNYSAYYQYILMLN